MEEESSGMVKETGTPRKTIDKVTDKYIFSEWKFNLISDSYCNPLVKSFNQVNRPRL